MKQAVLITTATAILGCAPQDGADVSKDAVPEYGDITTKLLDGDLVSFDVTMKGAMADTDVIAFNDCAAAQYALIRGAGFVRRVRNDVSKRGKMWTGTGIYTLSDAHPGGQHSIDAEITAQGCRANNIPMV